VLNALREARNERARTQFGAAVPKRLPSLVLAVVLITAGLGLLVVGGHLFVRGAVALAETMGVAPAVIGLSVVAIGTSLPELAASLVAAWRGYPDIAIGNVIGSNIFNVFGALGLTAAISPFGQGSVNDTDLWVMLGFSLLLMRFAHTGWRMERWEGGLLLAGFVVYLVILLT